MVAGGPPPARSTLPLWAKVTGGCALTVVALILAVVGFFWWLENPESRVFSVTQSPDTKYQVVVTESKGMVFAYVFDLYIEPLNSPGRGTHVARLTEPETSSTWGVIPRWIDSSTLDIQYVRAESAELIKPTINLHGRTITVALKPTHPGSSDAPGNDNQLQPAVYD